MQSMQQCAGGVALPLPVFLGPVQDLHICLAYPTALHIYFLVRCVWVFLSRRLGHKYFTIHKWVMITEYQGRGTPHWHIAAWIACFGDMKRSQGRESKNENENNSNTNNRNRNMNNNNHNNNITKNHKKRNMQKQ
jgi:hypothetical protein